MTSQSFSDLALHPSILRALAREGYQQPTPIQQAAIPHVLAGKDLMATAQTGTGKTAAFSLPMLQLLHESPAKNGKNLRALILTPTRELALQIDESLRTYGRYFALRTTVVVGGVPAPPQIRKLRQGPEILVATPGRLLDLLNQGHLRLGQIEMLVLDEADRMLDMGFIHDVRKIVAATPKKRQTLLFSATLSKEITKLAADMLHQPVKVEVTPSASVSDDIDQQVLFVEQSNKRALLTKMLRGDEIPRALVFTRTKHRANRISRQLAQNGISADAIHSNKSQNARQSALAAFDRGKVKVLVATDIVARGIDVEGISHVINYELPNDPESYVHRIGRTARAGAVGTALSFCNADEVALLKDIEKLTQRPLTPIEHPFHSSAIADQRQQQPADRPKQRRGKAAPRGPKRPKPSAATKAPRPQNRPAAATGQPTPAPAAPEQPLAFGRKKRRSQSFSGRRPGR